MSDVVAIADLKERQVATVRGRVASVRVEPRDAAPTMTARVRDDTGVVDAVFMGRREIIGVEPGAVIDIEGRVCAGESVMCIYNPSYVLHSQS